MAFERIDAILADVIDTLELERLDGAGFHTALHVQPTQAVVTPTAMEADDAAGVTGMTGDRPHASGESAAMGMGKDRGGEAPASLREKEGLSHSVDIQGDKKSTPLTMSRSMATVYSPNRSVPRASAVVIDMHMWREAKGHASAFAGRR